MARLCAIRLKRDSGSQAPRNYGREPEGAADTSLLGTVGRWVAGLGGSSFTGRRGSPGGAGVARGSTCRLRRLNIHGRSRDGGVPVNRRSHLLCVLLIGFLVTGCEGEVSPSTTRFTPVSSSYAASRSTGRTSRASSAQRVGRRPGQDERRSGPPGTAPTRRIRP